LVLLVGAVVLWCTPARTQQLYIPTPTYTPYVAPPVIVSATPYMYTNAAAADNIAPHVERQSDLFPPPAPRSLPGTIMMAANVQSDAAWGGSPVKGTEALMSQKAHGTSATPVQGNLRWGADESTADRICNYNRHFAEYAGYFKTTKFLSEAEEEGKRGDLVFYDSNSGKQLFKGPTDRTWDNFVSESKVHGWPSFRDAEVNWNAVRVLGDGEVVSVDGTHLGHNLPDGKGNRYCINLVSVAGRAA
jgi:peptide methionine sulfoxide reductase MsrB